MACKKCKKNKPLLSDRFNSSTEDIRKNPTYRYWLRVYS